MNPTTTLDNSWSDDIEKVLKSIHNSCLVYARYHKKRYFYLKGYLKYFRIPTIVISGINSVCSVGLQPYVAQTHISILTCVLALCCGIIASIESYLQIQASTESDLMVAKDFQLLAADIYKMLTLDRINRGVGGISYLDEKFGIYCKFIEGSLPLDKHIRDFLQLPTSPPPSGGSGRNGGYPMDQSDMDGSLYSTTYKRSTAIALGMAEPLLSALRLSTSESGSSVLSSSSSGSSSSGTSSSRTPNTNTNTNTMNTLDNDNDIDHNNTLHTEQNTEFNRGINRSHIEESMLEMLHRTHQNEPTPSEITIDLEQGL